MLKMGHVMFLQQISNYCPKTTLMKSMWTHHNVQRLLIDTAEQEEHGSLAMDTQNVPPFPWCLADLTVMTAPWLPFALSPDLYCWAARQAMWKRYCFVFCTHTHTELLSHMHKAHSSLPLNAAAPTVRATERHTLHASKHTAGRRKTE